MCPASGGRRCRPVRWRPGAVAGTALERYPILASRALGIPDFGHLPFNSRKGCGPFQYLSAKSFRNHQKTTCNAKGTAVIERCSYHLSVSTDLWVGRLFRQFASCWGQGPGEDPTETQRAKTGHKGGCAAFAPNEDIPHLQMTIPKCKRRYDFSSLEHPSSLLLANFTPYSSFRHHRKKHYIQPVYRRARMKITRNRASLMNRKMFRKLST